MHDSKWITDIANIIDTGPVEVVNITRLGKKSDDKPRLLKVQLSNLHQKRRILANAKMLRETSGIFQKVYVTSDLSLNERQENKHLRDEPIQHKKDGEKDLIIFLAALNGLDPAHITNSNIDFKNLRGTVTTYKSLKC